MAIMDIFMDRIMKNIMERIMDMFMKTMMDKIMKKNMDMIMEAILETTLERMEKFMERIITRSAVNIMQKQIYVKPNLTDIKLFLARYPLSAFSYIVFKSSTFKFNQMHILFLIVYIFACKMFTQASGSS